jgi:hypothetical protein
VWLEAISDRDAEPLASSCHETIDSLRRRSDRQPEPPALVQNEPSCYHFRALDSRVFATLSATMAAVTIGDCYRS